MRLCCQYKKSSDVSLLSFPLGFDCSLVAGEMASESPEDVYPVKTIGLAAKDSSGVFSPFKFSRRATGENDVQFKVLYCGICQYDREMSKNKFGMTNYPYVFGHEIVGVVTEVGCKVQNFVVGDKVGIGSITDSCGECEMCTNEVENYCPKAVSIDSNFANNYGGCSNIMVTTENFVIHWPENLPLDSGVPLLCAGINAYSPMRRYGLDKTGMRVGIAGLGGLGHVGVRFAKAFGTNSVLGQGSARNPIQFFISNLTFSLTKNSLSRNSRQKISKSNSIQSNPKVTVISSSLKKKHEALEKFGADSFLVSSDPEEMEAAAGTLDGIIDTIPADHPIEPLLALLKPLGKLIILGAPERPFEVPAPALLQGGKLMAASTSGSVKELQEMVDFAAKHSIVADVEIIPIDYVNTAMDRLDKSDVKYRFVIDMGNTLRSA